MPALSSPVLPEAVCVSWPCCLLSSHVLNAQNNPLAGDANISPKTSERVVVLARQLCFSVAVRQYTRAAQESQAAFKPHPEHHVGIEQQLEEGSQQAQPGNTRSFSLVSRDALNPGRARVTAVCPWL